MVHALPQFGAEHYQQLSARQDNVSSNDLWALSSEIAEPLASSSPVAWRAQNSTALARFTKGTRYQILHFPLQNDGFDPVIR
jgi:hypothetical protein